MPDYNNNGMFKFDNSQANFLRNFESIANNSLANFDQISNDAFGKQSRQIADQLNAMGVSPESGVFGAALGELGSQQQLQRGNLLRDLQSQLLGQRQSELGRLFDEDSFGKQFGLAQQKFGFDQKQWQDQLGLKQQELDQQKKANKRSLFKDIAEAGVDIFKFFS